MLRPIGGRFTATFVACVGFVVVLAGIVLACFPDAAETNKPLAVFKVIGSMVLLLVIGQIIYWTGARAGGGRREPGTGNR